MYIFLSLSCFYPLHIHPNTFIFFFFNDTAPTEIYTLSLHDALPIWISPRYVQDKISNALVAERAETCINPLDRKSTRLNSSHRTISYAVFCLKKKSNTWHTTHNIKKLRQLYQQYCSSA